MVQKSLAWANDAEKAFFFLLLDHLCRFISILMYRWSSLLAIQVLKVESPHYLLCHHQENVSELSCKILA